MLEHIRRPSENDSALADAFRAVIKLAKVNPSVALRVVFRKADGSIRTMDVAYDENIASAFSDNADKEANALRRQTNEARHNLVVRERYTDDAGNRCFRWRTIPLSRILSVSPML